MMRLLPPRIISGFTLIELMITLVVAAILLAFAIPSFDRFINRTNLSSEINNLVGILSLARSEAVTRRQRVTICRTTDPDCDGTGICSCNGGGAISDGLLLFASNPNNVTPTQFNGANDDLIRTYSEFTDRVTLIANAAANPGGNGTVSFMPDGTLDTSNDGPPTARFVGCALEVAGDAASTINSDQVPGKAIVINLGGRPRVAELPAGACIATAADAL